MQKWEYCVLTGASFDFEGLQGKYPKLYIFSLEGISVVDLGNKASSQRPKGLEKANEAKYIAYTIAKLGLDGWEMVSAANGTAGTQSKIFFRRQIE